MAKKTNYTITVIRQDETSQLQTPVKRVDPPSYNPSTNEPAFDRAWEQVAKQIKEGKLVIPKRSSAGEKVHS